MRRERVLHLGRLEPDPADLHLLVDAAEVHERAGVGEAHQVAGAVEAETVELDERPVAVQVPRGEPDVGDQQLAG
ncbi:unannotated protein [freshwater metagenome]|uniref:Unannotated protein n=1 Tax=freshwater metagenome TaxID=449393 RepID=A0A6J6C2P3_9ZZZZ